MDEVVILGTSRAIHEERQVITPSYIDYVQNVHKLGGGMVDKRPYLFATYVSLWHDVLGYSPSNAIYANMLLGACSLGLIWLVGAKQGGYAGAGFLAMIALASLPVFSQQVSGGGIDILNVFMLLALLATCQSFLEKPSIASFHLMAGVAVLLAYTRYESVLYWLVPAACTAVVYRRERHLFLDWKTPILMISLTPLWCVHFLNFSRLDVAVQTETVKAGAAFSLEFVSSNLIHALNFFLDTEHMATNSPLLFIVGFISLLLLAVSGLRSLHFHRASPASLCFWLFTAASLAGFFILMCYCWGQLDGIICNRLSLPVYLLFILGLVRISSMLRHKRLWVVVFSLSLTASAYWSIPPIAAKNYAANQYNIYRELDIYKNLVAGQPDRRFVVVHDLSNFWLTEDVYCIHPKAIDATPALLLEVLESAHFRRVFLIQRLNWNKKLKQYEIAPDYKVTLPLDVKVLSEDAINDQYRIRISQIENTTVQKLKASNLIVTEPAISETRASK